MEANINKEFETYVASVKTRSEDLIKNQFPRKIEELSKLLDSEQFSLEHQLKGLYQAVNIPAPLAHPKPSSSIAPNLQVVGGDVDGQNKKRKLDSVDSDSDSDDGDTVGAALSCGPMTCNSTLSKQIDTVKPFIRELFEDSNLLKRWITFLMPKIEAGNNLGVSIQEEISVKLMVVGFEADSLFDAITKYYLNRGKAISQVANYPHINDYRKHVAELDEKEFLSLRITLSKIRNHYATLYDLIGKNWEKIITPRSSNMENLY